LLKSKKKGVFNQIGFFAMAANEIEIEERAM